MVKVLQKKSGYKPAYRVGPPWSNDMLDLQLIHKDSPEVLALLRREADSDAAAEQAGESRDEAITAHSDDLERAVEDCEEWGDTLESILDDTFVYTVPGEHDPLLVAAVIRDAHKLLHKLQETIRARGEFYQNAKYKVDET